MKRSLVLVIFIAGMLVPAIAQTVTDLHFNHGDSAHYWVNCDLVYNIDLNINSTHVWDMTVPFGPEKMETMEIAEVEQGFYGSQFPYAEWVAINHDHAEGEISEAYMGRNGNTILLYGYSEDVTINSQLYQYDNEEGDSLFIFPLTPGKRWSNINKATLSDVAYLLSNITKEIVDTGQVITEVGTFPCVMMMTKMSGDVYLYGTVVMSFRYYQYDWYSDTLNTLASIRSRDGESRERFTIAERTQRIQEFWLGEAEPDVVENESLNPFFLRALPHPQGMMISYGFPEAASGRLVCYDATGRRLWEKSFFKGPGRYEFLASDLSAGVYFVRLDAAGGSQTARCVFVK